MLDLIIKKKMLYSDIFNLNIMGVSGLVSWVSGTNGQEQNAFVKVS